VGLVDAVGIDVFWGACVGFGVGFEVGVRIEVGVGVGEVVEVAGGKGVGLE
jgi:hypothetical protein